VGHERRQRERGRKRGHGECVREQRCAGVMQTASWWKESNGSVDRRHLAQASRGDGCLTGAPSFAVADGLFAAWHSANPHAKYPGALHN
jgi:hypothetical protein